MLLFWGLGSLIDTPLLSMILSMFVEELFFCGTSGVFIPTYLRMSRRVPLSCQGEAHDMTSLVMHHIPLEAEMFQTMLLP